MQQELVSRSKPTVVGIGASAGGLAALKKFFQSVPADSGLAFVVVVHLSAEHESHLADVLQPYVRFAVQQVTKLTAVEPNRVYIIPPNANINAIDTHLRLSKLEEQRQQRAPIDHFLRTLASTNDGNSVAVILTGTGSDGTLGIKDIKAKGGLVIVQDPNDAEFDGMPQSAIATGLADHIAPVAEMPEIILRFERTQPRVAVPDDGEDVAQNERQLLHKLFAQLRARTDRDFSRYKRSTILRRVAKRMQLNSVEELAGYVDKVRENPDEARALADELLITVTNFFRDPDAFGILEDRVFPKLLEGKNPEQAIRVWSVGCATGEEAYSLAMLLVEQAGRREKAPPIQIFASDLHRRSLDKAREGFYAGDIATDVGPRRLSRFFQKENGGYRVQKELRDLIVFAPHNLLGDPPFSRMDLITCRNLLMYLERDIQKDVIELFHYALNPGGHLLLGSAETIEASDLFFTEDKRLCLYTKRNVPAPEPRLPVFPLTRTRIGSEPGIKSERFMEPVAFGELHRRMAERFAPPSLLVSPDHKLAHLSENAGRYLVHPAGELTANVFKLIREELRIELQGLLQRSQEKREPADSKPIPVQINGHSRPVIIRVRPSVEKEHDGFTLVIFDDREADHANAGGTETRGQLENVEDLKRVAELEAELTSAHQRLNSIIEEYETSQEEMKAANEEMQSTNEELRSTMEELETSKEELQSINEELQTVNQENRHKVEELALLSGDLQNLLGATDIATLFLDRELRILRFTPKVGELFNIRVTDRARPISDLTHRLGDLELWDNAQAVLKSLVPMEREVSDEAGRWYLMRILPNRSAEDRIGGVVITLIDITTRRRAEDALRASEERYRLLIESAREYAIFMLSPEGRVATWNSGAEAIFGYSDAEIINRPGSILFTEEDRASGVPEGEMQTAAEQGRASDDRWHLRKDGSKFWASGTMQVLRSEGTSVRGFVKVLRDNTERKRTEDALLSRDRSLNASNEALSRANADLKQFAFAASHDLQEPVRMMSLYSQLLEKAWRNGHLEDAARAVGVMSDGARRIRELLNDLLVLTQLNANESDSREPIDLNVVAKETLENLQAAIQESGASITGDTLPTVQGRAAHFVHLFQNLLENAIKYRSGERPAKVHISLDQIDGHWRIAVADNGIGIEPQYFEQIFDMFKRLHSGVSGTGIGLAICKRVVERYGGRIWVESQPNQGATFYFTLPIRAN